MNYSSIKRALLFSVFCWASLTFGWSQCPDGYVADCSGDGDCILAIWIGDGYCDGADQQWGANLLCYDNDGGDCPYGETGCTDPTACNYDDLAVYDDGSCVASGDLNGDGFANILDLVQMMNGIVQGDDSDCADMDSNGTLNISDAVTLVQVILETPVTTTNSCPEVSFYFEQTSSNTISLHYEAGGAVTPAESGLGFQLSFPNLGSDDPGLSIVSVETETSFVLANENNVIAGIDPSLSSSIFIEGGIVEIQFSADVLASELVAQVQLPFCEGQYPINSNEGGSGCMHFQACNYNPEATSDDGSCAYNIGGGYFAPDALEMGIGSPEWFLNITAYYGNGMGSGTFSFIDDEEVSLVDFEITEEAFIMYLNGVELVFPITATDVLLVPTMPTVTMFDGIEQCEVVGCVDNLACNFENELEEPCSYFEEAEGIDMAEGVWLNQWANPTEWGTCDVLHHFELIEQPSGRFRIDMDYGQESIFLGPLSGFWPEGILADMELSICGEFLSIDQGVYGAYFDLPLVDGEYFDLGDVFATATKLYIAPGASLQTEACLDEDACNYSAEACGVLDYDNCIYPEDGLCPGEEAVPGCIDELACNYSAEANQSDGSCIYFSNENLAMDEVFYHSSVFNAPVFSSSSGFCSSIVFNPNEAVPLELEEGSVIDEPLYWQFSGELEELLDAGDGSSWMVVFGVTGDEIATDLANSPFAICENRIKMEVLPCGAFSSALPLISAESLTVYSGDWLGDHYSAAIGTFIPESLAQEGCTDPYACGYNPCAVPADQEELCTYPEEENQGCEVCDEGSVDLLITYDGFDGFPWEFSFEVENAAGELILDGAGAGEFEACIAPEECISITFYDEYGDGTSSYTSCGTITVFIDGQELGGASCNWGYETTLEVCHSTDCLDVQACNYGEEEADCVYAEENFGCEVCEGETVDLLISYDGLDGYPEEFSFTVEDSEGALLLDGAGAGDFEACIAADACITITMFDEYGDGMQGWAGSSCGTVTIFMDGEEVGDASCNWGAETSFILGACSGGCLDEEACNYGDFEAEECVYPEENFGCEVCEGESLDLLIVYDGADGYPEEFFFEVETLEGDAILYGEGAGQFEACVPADACFTVTLYDDWGDGTEGFPDCGEILIFLEGEVVASASCDWGYDISFNLGQCVGCMDPAACNYDATANVSSQCLYYDSCGECGGPGLPVAFALDAVLHMDEDEMGDFSSDASNPTPVPFAGEGTYILSGSAANFQTPNADPEYFSITIPAGYEISGIRMLEFDQVGYEAAGEPAGNGGFFGIGATDELPIIYGPADFPAAANALDGGWLVGVLPGTTEGYGILDDLMQPFVFPDFGINIPGLSEAPGAGTYTFMWKEGNAHPDAYDAYINWSFALEISAAGADHYTMLVDCDGCLNDSDDDGVCDELEIAGCTDASSCNYDPAATDDDGSCDDMPAAAAYCTEGTVWSGELCGCAPPSCLTDLDFNGETGTTDLLIMLSAFGASCE